MARKFKRLEPRFYRFENEGDVLVGKFLDTAAFKYANGDEGIQYILEEEDGGQVAINGTAGINRQMHGVNAGTWLMIEYKGEMKTRNGGSFKLFEISAATE